jgi:hypothetical protein
MGVGFTLKGRYSGTSNGKKREPAEWLGQLEPWFESEPLCHELFMNCQPTERNGNAALLVQFHVGGEDVDFLVTQPGRLTVSAKTSTLGPGYHIFLCDLLHKLGEEQGITWDPAGEDASDDETGYFHTGDRAAVEEAMLKHLLTVAAVTREFMDTGDFKSMAWAMPIGHHYDSFGPLVTLMGPRDRDWVEGILKDARNGIDVFPWWETGTGAAFRLNRALCEMWLNIRWRAPLDTDEQDPWEFVHADLCDAYKADPKLNYPWREWRELIEQLTEDDVEMEEGDAEVEKIVWDRGAEPSEHLPIGYRRQPVRVDLDEGWSITIPGEFAERIVDDDWKAFDQTRSVWFHYWRLEGEDGSTPPAEQLLEAIKLPDEEDAEWLEYKGEKVIGRASLKEYEEEGERRWNLSGRSAVPGQVALCNIFYRNESDRDWAIATWHSMNHS